MNGLGQIGGAVQAPVEEQVAPAQGLGQVAPAAGTVKYNQEMAMLNKQRVLDEANAEAGRLDEARLDGEARGREQIMREMQPAGLNETMIIELAKANGMTPEEVIQLGQVDAEVGQMIGMNGQGLGRIDPIANAEYGLMPRQ